MEGVVRLSRQEYRRVLSFFEKAAQTDTERSYWCDIGFCHGKLGQWPEAAAAFERVLAETEDLRATHVLNMLGHAYIKLGRYDEAVAVLTRALELEPHNLGTLHKLAVAHFHHGQAALAVRPLKRIVEVKPRHLKAQYDLGLVLHCLGDRQGVECQLGIVQQLDPTAAGRLREVVGAEQRA